MGSVITQQTNRDFCMTTIIPLCNTAHPTACAQHPPHTAHSSSTPSFWDDAAGLRDHWYIACTSAQLKTDQVRAVKLFGRGLAVFRQADGQPAAMIDQCVHRGARLSAGQVKDGCLTCPYHGWSYDGQGQVVHIPSVDGVTHPPQAHPFKQHSFPVIEQDGVIWVYLGDHDRPRPAVFKMPFYDRSDFMSYYMIGVYTGDLSAIAQINMDVSHTVFVHGKLFRTTAGKKLESTIHVKPTSVEVTYHNCNEGLGPIPWLTNPTRQPLVHTDRYFAPNITQVDYHWGDSSGFVFISVISPIDAQTSTLYTCISYKFPFPTLLLKTMRPLVHAYTKCVNTQDIRIMREQQAGFANAPMRQQHSVRADMAHVAIDKILTAMRQRTPIAEHALGIRRMDFEI
jgi:phenylpropionate dioxygenase-like ring-hydroxylating dioxygenase large terminal subunit